jgi:non-specific serine/threonine protein kinase
MLEVIRQFGAERLEEAGEVAQCRERHRDYFRSLAERFENEWTGSGQLAWIERLHAEQPNFRLAFDYSAGIASEAPSVMRMATVLEHYFASHGGGAEAVRWLRLALAHGTGTELERACALRVGCFIAVLLPDLDLAEQFHAELASMAEETGDERVTAQALYSAAVLRAWQGDPKAGAELAAAGVEVLHRLGDVSREANLHFLRGVMLGWADRPEDAAVAYQRCLDLTEPRGERWLTSYAKWGLGVDCLMAGDYDTAVRLEREALTAKAEFGDQLGVGLSIEALAWIAADQGRGEEAASLLGAAEAIWATIGMSIGAMPYLARRREDGFRAARGLLSPADFDRVIQQGRELRQEIAVAIALGSPPGSA